MRLISPLTICEKGSSNTTRLVRGVLVASYVESAVHQVDLFNGLLSPWLRWRRDVVTGAKHMANTPSERPPCPIIPARCSLLAFQRRFPDEAACVACLAAVRWPDGFRCSEGGHGKGWEELATKPFTWECGGCGRQTSVTAGTVMTAPGSRSPSGSGRRI